MEQYPTHPPNAFLRPNRRTFLWDILFWGGLLAMLIWAILKTIGYINSPPWQEAFPVFAFFLFLVAGSFKLGNFLGDLLRTTKIIQRDVHALGIQMGELHSKIHAMRLEFNELRTEFHVHMKQYHS